MNPMDMLRQARSSGYGAKSGGGSSGPSGSRSFPITPEEADSIGESNCIKVYGSHDGKIYTVDRLEPDTVSEEDDGHDNEHPVMVKTPTNISPS